MSVAIAMDGATHRQCSSCAREWPLSAEYFGIDRRSPGGLAVVCRPCRRARDRERHRAATGAVARTEGAEELARLLEAMEAHEREADRQAAILAAAIRAGAAVPKRARAWQPMYACPLCSSPMTTPACCYLQVRRLSISGREVHLEVDAVLAGRRGRWRGTVTRPAFVERLQIDDEGVGDGVTSSAEIDPDVELALLRAGEWTRSTSEAERADFAAVAGRIRASWLRHVGVWVVG